MGLELTTEADPIAVDAGFVLIGEKWPIAINPETVTVMEPRPATLSGGAVVEVQITILGKPEALRVYVIRFADILRAMEAAVAWRRTWPRG